MTDTIDISSLSEYGPAYAGYKAAVKAAKESDNPDFETMKAELAWERTRNDLTGIAVNRQQSDTRRAAALEQVRRDFPDAPADTYEHLTDPEKIVAVAKQVHEGINAKITAAQGSWGAPTSAGQSTDPVRAVHEQKLKLVPDVLKGDVNANEEFRRTIFRDQIGSRYDFSKPAR